MRRFGLIFSLTLMALAGGFAHGQTLRTTEAKLGEIVQQFNTPYIRNPMFMCYHMGRLQAFNDILAIQLHQLGTRASSNPQRQALTIAKGQQLHLKAERLLNGRVYDCDPAFAKKPAATLQGDEDLIKQIRITRRSLRSLSGEDIVVGCFHTGRLSMLSGRLGEMLRQRYAAGAQADGKLHTLLNDSAKDVRARSKRCKAQSIY